ncbi:hypothetical protein PFISCL1PPCAC_11011, partial [Pristionchus fissidentatus]
VLVLVGFFFAWSASATEILENGGLIVDNYKREANEEQFHSRDSAYDFDVCVNSCLNRSPWNRNGCNQMCYNRIRETIPGKRAADKVDLIDFQNEHKDCRSRCKLNPGNLRHKCEKACRSGKRSASQYIPVGGIPILYEGDCDSWCLAPFGYMKAQCDSYCPNHKYYKRSIVEESNGKSYSEGCDSCRILLWSYEKSMCYKRCGRKRASVEENSGKYAREATMEQEGGYKRSLSNLE